RSNTQARLDREIHSDESVYQYYPFMVISIDYIKSDQRRQVFIQDCPELVIVDEAHTCAKPEGTNVSFQQRYKLIHDIASKSNQHLILLTATPHSGKNEEFKSLLGLLNKNFVNTDLPNSTQNERKTLAKHFVQRRRADVIKWMNEETPFPKRDAGEFQYPLSKQYQELFDKTLEFARGITEDIGNSKGKQRMKYWSALALLRGVLSSPAAGVEMLVNRFNKIENDNFSEDNEFSILEDEYVGQNDFTPFDLIINTKWDDPQKLKLAELAKDLDSLKSLKLDSKLNATLIKITEWIKDGYNPVIFCRYIATANYIGKYISDSLKKEFKNIDVQVITSEDPDKVRKQRITDMGDSPKRLLIATDCLSEGINLQEYFTAVLHYDLPWNPNRLEQREGRVDRFGQKSPNVKAYLLYGENNPIDGVVLKVLLRKVREIKKSIGISIPFPDDSKSILDAVLQTVLLKPNTKVIVNQDDLFAGIESEINKFEIKASKEIEDAANRESASRNIFAQNSIKADEIEEDLKQTDEAIGNPKTVEDFVINTLQIVFGVQINKILDGYLLFTNNLPETLKELLPKVNSSKNKIVPNEVKISFHSPVSNGFHYLGRNNPFVEHLCQLLLSNTLLKNEKYAPSRASVVRCKEVDIKTTIFSLRVRNVIEEKFGKNQLVSEEMFAWGYRGSPKNNDFLTYEETKKLLENVVPIVNMSPQEQADFFESEMKNIEDVKNKEFRDIALERAKILVEAHERFRKATDGNKFQEVNPVLPMDIIGIYILLPIGGVI
ncbi:MAG: helicase-related protein, partial [Candidatus Kapabacteria bacterium]|nr:helicase-related protein [Candidatus Kapabacteria bacterium]